MLKLKEIDPPWLGTQSKDVRAYIGKKGLQVIYSKDNHPDYGILKHVSISKPDEYPSWDEIMEVKIKIFGDRTDAMMLMPKRENYVNIHNNCFHLWECPQDWNIK